MRELPHEVHALIQRIHLGAGAKEQLDEVVGDHAEDKRPFGVQRRLRRLVRDGERASRDLVQVASELVETTARDYLGQGLDLADLVRHGEVGLANAAERFQGFPGADFSTYATWWIRQAMSQAVADQTRGLRLPANATETINRLQSAQQEMLHRLERDPTVEELAAELDLSAEVVRSMLGFWSEGRPGDSGAASDSDGAPTHTVALAIGQPSPRPEHAAQAAWNRLAATYADSMAFLTSHVVGELLVAANVVAGSRVLDLGCGPGHVVHELVQRKAEVCGADVSPGMVAVAAALNPDAAIHEADAQDLPFIDESFDAVVSNFSLHHVASPARACSEVGRVLTFGGRFVLATPLLQSAFQLVDGVLHDHGIPIDGAHSLIREGPGCAYYEQTLIAAGFKIASLETMPTQLVLDELEPLLRAVWTIYEIHHLPANRQHALREAIFEAAAPNLVVGSYHFDDEVVFGVAIKRDSGGHDRAEPVPPLPALSRGQTLPLGSRS